MSLCKKSRQNAVILVHVVQAHYIYFMQQFTSATSHMHVATYVYNDTDCQYKYL